MSGGHFRVLGENRYRVAFVGQGVEFDLDRLRRERHELVGELAVSTTIVGAKAIDGLLSVGSLNVSSPRARQERARLLAERARTKEIDWLELLEEVCQRVLAAERIGAPAVELRTVARPTRTAVINVKGWQLPWPHPTILFGDGGCLKSYLGLVVAGDLEANGKRVLYADWELDKETHRERLEQIYGSDMPAVQYARCDRPLVHEVDRLSRIIRNGGIEYVILDSVAFGCAGPPEAAEIAAEYFRAVRQLGIGALLIAHITKGENGDQRPFGSVFWHNSARATWFAKAVAPTSDTERVVGLINRKSNLGPLLRPVAFEVTFDPDRTLVRPVDAGEVDDLAAALPLWQRMRYLVRRGPMTLLALATELNAKVDTLDRLVRRHKGLFTRVDGPDGVSRIALLDRGVA